MLPDPRRLFSGDAWRAKKWKRIWASHVLLGLYSALLAAGLLLSTPWWLARLLTMERYREGLRERLGRVPQRLREAVKGKQVVWVHAVSVGEVLAASRLVTELGVALGSDWCVVVSTTTRTGQALARERFGAERVFYYPLDLKRPVRAYLRALQPALVVLMESELWPRMLYECGRASVPVAVANARMSDRSFRRARRVRGLWRHVLAKVSLWLPQSGADAERLRGLGVKAKALDVAGNLKYDIRAPRQSRVAELIREAANGRPVVVAGSTTAGVRTGDPDEFQLAIQAWENAARAEHRAVLVLAPRHPENFGVAYSVAKEFSTLRATELLAGKAVQGVEIIVLDTIGDLAAVYGVADVAFVGGSLVGRGGHNPLEPAQWSVPVVMGPSSENFRDIVGKLREADALRVVKDVDGLASAIVSLLNDRAAARQTGERGKAVFEEHGGATARTVAALLTLLASQDVAVKMCRDRPEQEARA